MEWKNWLENLDRNITIKTTRRAFDKISPWKVLKRSIRRIDNLFFKVLGFSVTITKNGLSVSWNQILLETEDPIHGWLMLIVAEETNRNYYLFSARAEAGWESLGLGPTFQASKSNLEKNPGLPRRELAECKAFLILQDGGIYFNKRNYAGAVVYSSRDKFEKQFGTNENERWFTEDEFFQALEAGKVSEHLLQAKACYRIK